MPKHTIRALVVDDDAISRKLLVTCLSRIAVPGVAVEIDEVVDGEAGVACHAAKLHDIVLMDVHLPKLDGLSAARLIRQAAVDTTVIFVSGSTEEDLMLKAFDTGIDFVTKPIMMLVMARKLSAHLQRILARREVTQLNELHSSELALASNIIDHLRERVTSGTGVKSFSRSLHECSGDMVLHLDTPAGTTYVLHADCVGHGLPAVLTLLPVIPIFSSMAKKGFGIEQIAIEMNRGLRQLMPMGRFIAAALVQFDHRSGRGLMLNCGLPPAAIAGPDRYELLPSRNLPLGMVQPTEFTVSAESFALERTARLWMMSDGLTELLEARALRACMKALTIGALESRLDASNVLGFQHDDISVSTLEWLPTEQPGAAPSGNVQPCPLCPTLPVTLNIRLTVDLLKQPSVVDQLVSTVHGSGLVRYAHSTLSTILVELLTNALDHGLLGLSSEQKYAGNFADYYAARETALAALTEGAIDISLRAEQVDGVSRINLRVSDSGPGYSLDVSADVEQEAYALAGRGLPLIRQLAESVTVNADGTCTEVVLIDRPMP